MASGRQLRAPLLCGHEQQGAAASRGRGKQATVEVDTHTAALWLGPGERKEMALLQLYPEGTLCSPSREAW